MFRRNLRRFPAFPILMPMANEMANEQVLSRDARSGRGFRAGFGAAEARGKIIDQDGREIPQEELRDHLEEPFAGFQFDFRRSSANPFATLTREERLTRLETIAKILDVAFILPGTKVRYGVDGIIGLIPVVGDIIVTTLSLWLVREARALGAPWHITARMLGNVAFQGLVGTVPVAGDVVDVLYRANMRNARLVRRWLESQPR